ncbi:uncharacterized protein CDAR_101441 [Caerostris darwini]|uniref:Uncharacterized protein n=1 Tax=Caerostris darwini TaxID=1538125 RepID=A0AAV4W488_9ARAC|nr:uncharacterized protein CDAR_101441 [Caerostris darwini]
MFFLCQKRGLLKRSKALTMDMGDRVSHFRSGLMSLPEYESDSLRSEHSEEDEEAEDALPFPNLPDRLLVNIGLFGPYNDKPHFGIGCSHSAPIFWELTKGFSGLRIYRSPRKETPQLSVQYRRSGFEPTPIFGNFTCCFTRDHTRKKIPIHYCYLGVSGVSHS